MSDNNPDFIDLKNYVERQDKDISDLEDNLEALKKQLNENLIMRIDELRGDIAKSRDNTETFIIEKTNAIWSRINQISNNIPTAAETYKGLKEHPEFKRVSSTMSALSVDLTKLADTVSELDIKVHEKLGDLNVHEKQTASYVNDIMREIKDLKKTYNQDMLFIAGFLIGAGWAEAAEVIKLFHSYDKEDS